MYVIIPKSASEQQIKKMLEKFEEQRKKRKQKSGKGNILKHLGSNPNEVDGKIFQKKVRSEWD